MPDIADKLTQKEYVHPKAKVYVSTSLTDFRNGTGGTEWKFLYVESLKLCAAPETDSAELVYDVGYKINLAEAQFSPETASASMLKGKAVKISIPDTVIGTAQYEIVWFGIIDTVTTEGVSVGKLKVQAVGMLQMADKQKIRSSYTLDSTGNGLVEIGIGLPFNSDGADFFGVYGNRSVNKQTVPSDHYVFAFENRGREKWTTHTAVQYLLAKHPPKNVQKMAMPEWILHPDTIANPPGEWYDTQLATDGKSLKELLDELIPRKRALSYYVYYDDAIQKVVLKMFTFVDQRIEVSQQFATPRYLEANPNKITANLNESIWFTDDCSIIESTDAQFDAVVAYGERCTSTCTLGFSASPPQFRPDWSSDDETAYKTAKSTTDKEANARFRSEERYAHVYRRFRLSDNWDGRAYPYTQAQTTTYYWADPTLNDAGVPRQPSDPTGNPAGFPLRVRGLRLLRHLPLKDRIDYSGNNLDSLAVRSQIEQSVLSGDGDSEYIAPMFLWRDGQKYILVDNLSTATEGLADASKRRGFSVSVSFATNEPSVELTVSSHRQTMIARTEFTGATGVYDTNWDPAAKNGINFQDFFATVCLQLEHRFTVRQQITVAPDSRPERVLELQAKDARLDYLVPKTIVALDNGTAVYSDGGYLRDDRERVKAVVKATAEWYGRPRRAVSFGYRQPRKLCNIGDLITDLDGLGLSQSINTPVTSITYTLGSGNTGGATKIETGFAEVDFT